MQVRAVGIKHLFYYLKSGHKIYDFAYIFSFKNFIKLHISLVVLPQIIMRP